MDYELVPEPEVRPITTDDIERATETRWAMAAIPCLRGGYVPFDLTSGLEAHGWGDDDCGFLETLYAEVPDTPDVAVCRASLESAIDDRRALIERNLDRVKFPHGRIGDMLRDAVPRGSRTTSAAWHPASQAGSSAATATSLTAVRLVARDSDDLCGSTILWQGD